MNRLHVRPRPVALVARLCCGIYGGPHRRRLEGDFMNVLTEVLNEPADGAAGSNGGAGTTTRGHFFLEVLVPLLE